MNSATDWHVTLSTTLNFPDAPCSHPFSGKRKAVTLPSLTENVVGISCKCFLKALEKDKMQAEYTLAFRNRCLFIII